MTKITYPKQLISFADQIALLKQRGLIFTDEAKAMHLLRNISTIFVSLPPEVKPATN